MVRDSGSSVLARILLVVAYSAQFRFPLTQEEIIRRFWQFDSENTLMNREIFRALKILVESGFLKERGGYYFLPHMTVGSIFDRKQRQKYSIEKLHSAEPVFQFFTKLPWVVGVAITGSVSVASAKKNDDVDFMIITKPNRLWLTRILTLLFAMRHGKRRSFAKEEPNSWCFNLWLTTNALSVPQPQRRLYTAYEVCQAEWYINKDQTAQRFLEQNLWVKELLPNYFEWRKTQLSQTGITDPTWSTSLVVGWLLSGLNAILYWLQLIYMWPHRTTERVAWDHAWFHPKKRI